MTGPAATAQGLGSAGRRGTHVLTVVLVVIAFLWAIVLSALALVGGADPVQALGALGLLGIACACVISASGGGHGVFTAGIHLTVHVLVVAGFIAASWSSWSPGAASHDQWAPLTLGVMMVAVAPYRPARELIAASTVSALALGAVTYLHAVIAHTAAPPLALAVIAGVGVVAPGYAAAVYSLRTIEEVQRWRRRSDGVAVALADEVRGGLARSVQHDRVALLGRDVVPFLGDLLGREAVTAADRDRARALATAIRRMMVADADRTWLEVVAHGGDPSGGSSIVVDDPDALAATMTASQRTALRALIAALAADSTVADGFSIVLSRQGRLCVGTIRAPVRSAGHSLRTRCTPIYAIMRVAFNSLGVQTHFPDLIVRFTYEQS